MKYHTTETPERERNAFEILLIHVFLRSQVHGTESGSDEQISDTNIAHTQDQR